MNLLGALFLSAAGLMAGLTAAGRLRVRLRRCGELCELLSLLSFELERFRTPLPELFSSLADTLPGAGAALCSRAADGLARQDAVFRDVWRGALGGLPAREREILLPLGRVLGRYGAPEQLAAAAEALRRMRALREELAGEAARRGRLYIGVCTAGGLMLAVLLL